jgi:hypothetical protein
MNYYLLSLLTLFLGFFFYCHIYQYIKKTNHYEILQAGNPSPDNLEKMFLEKSPIVITDLLNNWDGFNQIDFEYLKVQPDLTKDKVVVKLLDKYSRNYLLPFKISHQYQNNNYLKDKNPNTPLKKVSGHRHMIIQLEGKMRYVLFYPKQSTNLYNGKIDFWGWEKLSKEDKEKYPLFPKAAYIELILSKGTILHLPKDWWFACDVIEDSLQMTIDSNSIFSYFIK